MILLCLTAYKSHNGTDVVELSWPLGIGTAAMVRAHNGIAGIEKGTDGGAKVCHTFAIVAKPSTAIDMNYYGITVFLLLWQIDVAGMKDLAIADIVDIFPLLRSFQSCFLLYASKASSRLC